MATLALTRPQYTTHPGFVRGQPNIDEFLLQNTSNVEIVSMPSRLIERWQPSFIVSFITVQ